MQRVPLQVSDHLVPRRVTRRTPGKVEVGQGGMALVSMQMQPVIVPTPTRPENDLLFNDSKGDSELAETRRYGEPRRPCADNQ